MTAEHPTELACNPHLPLSQALLLPRIAIENTMPVIDGGLFAAGLWMTAAIGVAAGLGREATAVLSTLLALAIFSVMPVIIRALEREDKP